MLIKSYRIFKELIYYLAPEEKTREKIFCIGLSRTGTTSLTKALTTLGYNAVHCPSFWYNPFNGQICFLKHQLKEYDGFSDISVIPFFKFFDSYFSNAKFILTTRDLDGWLASCKRFENFSTLAPLLSLNRKKLHEKIYGSVEFDRRLFTEAYQRHMHDVKQYFKGREEDLLIMNIPAGDGWAKLCPFLNKTVPQESFPRANRGKTAAKT